MKLTFFIITFILFLAVSWLIWENRGSNSLLIKYYSIVLVGLITVSIFVLYQDKKEDIVYETSTVLFIDKKKNPIILVNSLEGKDQFIEKVFSELTNIELESEKYYKNNNKEGDFYLDFITRTFINMFENVYYETWDIDYKYDELTNYLNWEHKYRLENKHINISDLNIFTNQNFKFSLIENVLNKEGFNIPKDTEVIIDNKTHNKTIKFNNKYFTYTITIDRKKYYSGYEQFSTIYGNELLIGGHYYFDIKTHCEFFKYFSSNPKVEVYQEWITNTNNLIDFFYNTNKNIRKSIEKNNMNIQNNRYKYNHLKNIEDILGVNNTPN